MKKQQILTQFLAATTLTFGYLWYSTKNELDLYHNTDRIYLDKENSRCDIYRWKSNQKLASKGCDIYEDGFYETISDYNFYGELLATSHDYNHDGLFEIIRYYNYDGILVSLYEDTDFDGFDDKKTIFLNDTIKETFIDINRNRIYEVDEKNN